MKLKIEKLQAGGYLSYQPLPIIPDAQTPQVAPAEKEDDKDKKDGYLDKEVLGKMLGSGITTDVIEYSEKLEQAHSEYASMSDFQKASYKGRQIRSLLKGDMGQLNALMRSKNMFDKSIETAKSNGALEEFAVTDGAMVVKERSTGKVTAVSFAQFAQDKDAESPKYQALTNAQLAEEREFNKQLISNTTVFSVLNYGKGIEKVKAEIFASVQNLGKDKKSVQNGEFTQMDPEDVQNFVQAAQQGMFKVKSGQSIETNSPQLEKAKQAMWLNLSDNSKNVLRARAANQVGDSADIEKMAMTMAASLLDPQESTSISKTYDESMRAGAKGKGGGDKEKMADLGPNGQAYAGGTNMVPLSQIGPFGVNIEGFGNALPVSNYTNEKNERVSLRNAGKLNELSYLSKAFTVNGDQVQPDTTVITGDAYVSKLPYTIDAQGNYKIDEEGSKRWAEYEKALGQIPEQERTALKQSELKTKFDVQNFKVKKFIVAEASSYDPSFWGSRDENYYQKLEGPELDMLGELVDSKEDNVRDWIDNSAHKHLIFIPAKDEATFNNVDKNYMRVPESVYDPRGGYNQGRGGMNSMQGESMGSSLIPQNVNSILEQ